MKTDLYTKTMLTLIVLLLGVLSFNKVYDSVVRETEASTTNAWNCDLWGRKFIMSHKLDSYLALNEIQQIEMVEDPERIGIFICMR